MKNFLLIFCNVLLSVTGQILLKQGMNQVGKIEGAFSQIVSKIFQALSNPFVIGGIGVYGSTTLIWLVILSRIKLSVAYPMISLGYVITIMFSWLLFKEDVPKLRVLGGLVICIGVYLVSKGEFGN